MNWVTPLACLTVAWPLSSFATTGSGEIMPYTPAPPLQERSYGVDPYQYEWDKTYWTGDDARLSFSRTLESAQFSCVVRVNGNKLQFGYLTSNKRGEVRLEASQAPLAKQRVVKAVWNDERWLTFVVKCGLPKALWDYFPPYNTYMRMKDPSELIKLIEGIIKK